MNPDGLFKYNSPYAVPGKCYNRSFRNVYKQFIVGL
jgi:hypothetical protein